MWLLMLGAVGKAREAICLTDTAAVHCLSSASRLS